MRFGVFYELQLPRPWEDGAERRIVREAIEQVQIADRIGIHHAWAVEHHFLEEYSHLQKPHPPMWLGCANRKTIEAAARNGLGAPGWVDVHTHTTTGRSPGMRCSRLRAGTGSPPSSWATVAWASHPCEPAATTIFYQAHGGGRGHPGNGARRGHRLELGELSGVPGRRPHRDAERRRDRGDGAVGIRGHARRGARFHGEPTGALPGRLVRGPQAAA